MNSHDHIVRVLRDKPLDFSELRAAINIVSDPRFPWSEEWLLAQLEVLEFRRQIEKDGTSYKLAVK
jgi:DNA-binding HxlR family transcriptional regulator